MSLIDWSDPDEMFGLLIDYVADEEAQTDDGARHVFLARLRSQLESLMEQFVDMPLSKAIGSLRAIHQSINDEFEHDPVVEHLGACVEELERVERDQRDERQ